MNATPRLTLGLAACLIGIASASSMAAEATFASRQAAEDYLAKALPLATSRNPAYLTKSEGVQTWWLLKTVRFADAPTGVHVAMDEEFPQVKSGVKTTGAHQAAFSLGEVDISVIAEAGDVTPSGEPAMAILFKCAAPKCIEASWNGQPAPSDKTDIYVQDAETREQILGAFKFLMALGKAR
jgi:hypothetical protein